ncbi:Hypothetical predicted protein, partial [Olea europaea subsp. europaea]
SWSFKHPPFANDSILMSHRLAAGSNCLRVACVPANFGALGIGTCRPGQVSRPMMVLLWRYSGR